jgi:hypothetical protein
MSTDSEPCGAKPPDLYTSPCERKPGHAGLHHGCALGPNSEIIERVWLHDSCRFRATKGAANET